MQSDTYPLVGVEVAVRLVTVEAIVMSPHVAPQPPPRALEYVPPVETIVPPVMVMSPQAP